MSIFSLFGGRSASPVPERDGYLTPRAGKPVLPIAGDTIVLEVVPSDQRSLPARYQATVKTVGIRRVVIEAVTPLVPGQASSSLSFPFAKPHSVTATFVRDDVLYRFDTIPLRPSRAGDTPREISLTRPSRVSKLERRGFFRMMVEATTIFRLEPGPRDQRLPARLRDLSAGGVLLTTSVALKAGQRIVVLVPTEKTGEPRDVVADVLECRPRPEAGRTGYMVRARFVTEGSMRVDIGTKEAIVHYIFEQQRLMLRTRKLTLG